jgi:hypothetical protein
LFDPILELVVGNPFSVYHQNPPMSHLYQTLMIFLVVHLHFLILVVVVDGDDVVVAAAVAVVDVDNSFVVMPLSQQDRNPSCKIDSLRKKLLVMGCV